MKYCAHCGQQLQDEVQFCERCGASTTPEAAQFKEEKDFLDSTHRFLKYERIAWKVLGIFALVLGIIYFAFGILITAGFAEMVMSDVPESAFGLGLVTIIMGFCSLVFIAIAVVGLVSAKKITGYMNEMYTDIRATEKRCTSIGLLILSIFFNEIAMIFFLVNFARFKGNQKLVERISRRQQGQ